MHKNQLNVVQTSDKGLLALGKRQIDVSPAMYMCYQHNKIYNISHFFIICWKLLHYGQICFCVFIKLICLYRVFLQIWPPSYFIFLGFFLLKVVKKQKSHFANKSNHTNWYGNRQHEMSLELTLENKDSEFWLAGPHS